MQRKGAKMALLLLYMTAAMTMSVQARSILPERLLKPDAEELKAQKDQPRTSTVFNKGANNATFFDFLAPLEAMLRQQPEVNRDPTGSDVILMGATAQPTQFQTPITTQPGSSRSQVPTKGSNDSVSADGAPEFLKNAPTQYRELKTVYADPAGGKPELPPPPPPAGFASSSAGCKVGIANDDTAAFSSKCPSYDGAEISAKDKIMLMGWVGMLGANKDKQMGPFGKSNEGSKEASSSSEARPLLDSIDNFKNQSMMHKNQRVAAYNSHRFQQHREKIPPRRRIIKRSDDSVVHKKMSTKSHQPLGTKESVQPLETSITGESSKLIPAINQQTSTKITITEVRGVTGDQQYQRPTCDYNELSCPHPVVVKLDVAAEKIANSTVQPAGITQDHLSNTPAPPVTPPTNPESGKTVSGTEQQRWQLFRNLNLSVLKAPADDFLPDDSNAVASATMQVVLTEGVKVETETLETPSKRQARVKRRSSKDDADSEDREDVRRKQDRERRREDGDDSNKRKHKDVPAYKRKEREEGWLRSGEVVGSPGSRRSSKERVDKYTPKNVPTSEERISTGTSRSSKGPSDSKSLSSKEPEASKEKQVPASSPSRFSDRGSSSKEVDRSGSRHKLLSKNGKHRDSDPGYPSSNDGRSEQPDASDPTPTTDEQGKKLRKGEHGSQPNDYCETATSSKGSEVWIANNERHTFVDKSAAAETEKESKNIQNCPPAQIDRAPPAGRRLGPYSDRFDDDWENHRDEDGFPEVTASTYFHGQYPTHPPNSRLMAHRNGSPHPVTQLPALIADGNVQQMVPWGMDKKSLSSLLTLALSHVATPGTTPSSRGYNHFPPAGMPHNGSSIGPGSGEESDLEKASTAARFLVRRIHLFVTTPPPMLQQDENANHQATYHRTFMGTVSPSAGDGLDRDEDINSAGGPKLFEIVDSKFKMRVLGYALKRASDARYRTRECKKLEDDAAVAVIDRAARARDLRFVPLEGFDCWRIWLQPEAALSMQLLTRGAGKTTYDDIYQE